MISLKGFSALIHAGTVRKMVGFLVARGPVRRRTEWAKPTLAWAFCPVFSVLSPTPSHTRWPLLQSLASSWERSTRGLFWASCFSSWVLSSRRFPWHPPVLGAWRVGDPRLTLNSLPNWQAVSGFTKIALVHAVFQQLMQDVKCIFLTCNRWLTSDQCLEMPKIIVLPKYIVYLLGWTLFLITRKHF